MLEPLAPSDFEKLVADHMKVDRLACTQLICLEHCLRGSHSSILNFQAMLDAHVSAFVCSCSLMSAKRKSSIFNFYHSCCCTWQLLIGRCQGLATAC